MGDCRQLYMLLILYLLLHHNLMIFSVLCNVLYVLLFSSNPAVSGYPQYSLPHYSSATVYPQYPLPHYSSATVYKSCSIRISTVSTSSLQQCYCIQMLQYQDIHSIHFLTAAVLLYTNAAVSGYPQYPLPHCSSLLVY
jgi:hypothetical protein